MEEAYAFYNLFQFYLGLRPLSLQPSAHHVSYQFNTVYLIVEE